MNHIFYNLFQKKNLFYKSFVIIGLLISWNSLSSNYGDLTIGFSKFLFSSYNIHGQSPMELKLFINFFRTLCVLIYFIISLFFFLIFYQKNNFILKDNIFYLFMFLYFFLQIPGLFFSENYLINIYYIISAINIISIFHLASKIFDNKELKILLYISLFYLFCIFLFFFIKDLYKFFTLPGSFYRNFYNTDLYFNMVSPRSSGMSRTAIILLIISSLFTHNTKLKYIKNLTILFFSTVVILYQSRTTMGLLFGLCILQIFFFQEYDLKSITKKILIYLIFPFFLATTITMAKSMIYINKNTKIINQTSSSLVEEKTRSVLQNAYYLGLVRGEQENFSSNRFSDWLSVINEYQTNKNISFLLSGYGSQGDRFYLNQTVSNAVLYALISSGIPGVICLLIVLIFIMINLLNFLTINRDNFRKNNCHIYYLLIIVLIARSVFETSYAVFSIDLILLTLSWTMLQSKKKDKSI